MKPGRSLLIEHFFAVRRYLESRNRIEHLVDLSLFEFKLLKARASSKECRKPLT